ncbi:Gas vesicle protein GvpN [Methanosarcina vacuolata Z-761]|uniref:Gas vesicle protein GvpN n=2 Tax=Methanosarcina vacuolata TaxID=2215 RepID=A0A0E3Q977_9EURY|nr:Gas vesicle protein GvpN [Methanosarcina vacuolata Z-761]
MFFASKHKVIARYKTNIEDCNYKKEERKMKYKATHQRIVRGKPIHKTLEETKQESDTEDLNPIKEPLPYSVNLKNCSEEKKYLVPEMEYFINNTEIQKLSERIKLWIKVGYPVHLIGPTGCGKTSLAVHIAKEIGRPVIWINGDESLTTKDLIGGYAQIKQESVRDNYIHNVFKSSDIIKPEWIDNPLAIACRYGYTLIYNEFSRAKPIANNVLLSVFEEGILELPSRFGGEKYIKVHPDFRAILTSNSIEYAGVHVPQDALLDRMVGIYMDYYSFETEVQIVKEHTGLPEKDTEKIVSIIRKIRDQTDDVQKPGIRSGIMVGKAMKKLNGNTKDYFDQLFVDVIATKTSSNAELLKKEKIVNEVILELNSEKESSNAEMHETDKSVDKTAPEINKKQDPVPVIKAEKTVSKTAPAVNKKQDPAPVIKTEKTVSKPAPAVDKKQDPAPMIKTEKTASKTTPEINKKQDPAKVIKNEKLVDKAVSELA